MPEPPVIETRGLTRRFGERTAVHDVDLRIDRGEVFGCLGPNGSGKSTLMRVLLGLLEPSEGSARVLGHSMPADAEKLRPCVGYMTQRFSLYEELTARENLDFAAEVFGIPLRRRRSRVAQVIEELELGEYARMRAGELSGGWKQRLSLAAATIHQPELLVLDEPTAGVDPQSRRTFWEKLFELAGGGTTLFVSTHYMDEAVRCHRLCILSEGRRAALGSPSGLSAPLARRVLDVHVEHPERAIEALRTSTLVASTTQLGATVHVLLAPDAPPPTQAAERMLEVLRGQGLRARADPAQVTLEDVFIALLQGETLDGGEGPRP